MFFLVTWPKLATLAWLLKKAHFVAILKPLLDCGPKKCGGKMCGISILVVEAVAKPSSASHTPSFLIMILDDAKNVTRYPKG